MNIFRTTDTTDTINDMETRLKGFHQQRTEHKHKQLYIVTQKEEINLTVNVCSRIIEEITHQNPIDDRSSSDGC